MSVNPAPVSTTEPVWSALNHPLIKQFQALETLPLPKQRDTIATVSQESQVCCFYFLNEGKRNNPTKFCVQNLLYKD